MSKELYHKLKVPSGVTLPECPFCGSDLELWEYCPEENYATKVVCCSNSGDEENEIYECPLYMPSEGFYKSTKRDAIAVYRRLMEKPE